MSVQTPADKADKYFLNTDMRNALRNDIEDPARLDKQTLPKIEKGLWD